MEYLEGKTLAERLEQGDSPGDEIPTFLAQICDALDAAHGENIVHRDLKPENVWIVTPEQAATRSSSCSTSASRSCWRSGERPMTRTGTPSWARRTTCRPSSATAAPSTTARTSTRWACCMYRMYSGRLPIQGQTYAEILAKQIIETPPPPSTLAPIPAPLDRVIMSCLAKDPAGRPQSAGELGAALGAIFGLPSLLVSGPVSVGSAGLATIPVSAAVKAPAVLASAPTAVPAPDSLAPVSGPASVKKGVSRAVIALVVAAVLGAAAWLALRPAHQAPMAARPAPEPAPERAAAPATPPAVAAPTPPAPPAVAPPATPAAPSPAAPAVPEAVAAHGPRPARASRKHEAPARPEPEPTRAKKEHDRATDTGLVTDNPFQ